MPSAAACRRSARSRWSGVRVPLYAVAALAAALLVPPTAGRAALAATAAVLLEATPFLMLAAALARLPRLGGLAPYLGCGCGPGPSARSIPAAWLTALAFGPWIAAARLAAAALLAGLRPAPGGCAPSHPPGLLAELRALLPAALLAGAIAPLLPLLDAGRQPPLIQGALGAALGWAFAPCALGSVAIAAALHGRAPIAATAYLCIAGVVDLRAPRRDAPHRHATPDALAWLLLALALAIAGLQHGAALVHPMLAPALLAGGAFALIAAGRAGRIGRPTLRWAPLLMLLGILINAPAPQYRATATTLGGLFAGERLSFTGRLVRARTASAVVRFAITCCRADAAPIVVRLAHAPRLRAGTWLRVEGSIVERADGFRLLAQRITPIAPPRDPFVYR